jgi:hypothetical protein
LLSNPYLKSARGVDGQLKNPKIPKMKVEEISVDPLKNYLDYYKKLEDPRFAVLVTGDWGSGKTYQVKAALDPGECNYISLFGLKDDAAIYGAILAKMDPEAYQYKKFQKWAADKSIVGFPVGGIVSAALDAAVKSKVKNNKILIFDDYERSSIDPKVLLGLINFYVEHNGCRVVIIAHDEKIIEGFKDEKEKIIGQTIRVVPQTEAALAHFIKETKEQTQNFISVHRDVIDRVIDLSRCQSLRILRQVLFDIGRFQLVFMAEQLESNKLVAELLAVFVALNIELRLGNLGRKDLDGRTQSYVNSQLAMHKKEGEKGYEEELKQFPLLVCNRKYSAITEIIADGFGDALLIEMLIEGKFNKNSIQKHFQLNSLFAESANWPPWLTFMHFDKLPDTSVENAARRMDEQFENREVKHIGEFLHIAAFRLMRGQQKLLNETPIETVEKCKSYLDDLVNQGEFPIDFYDGLLGRNPAHAGYGIWSTAETNIEFEEIRKYIVTCRESARLKQFPVFKEKIVVALKSDGDEFYELFSPRKNSPHAFRDISVLASIPPVDFVNLFLKLPHEKWREIQHVLNNRILRIRGDEQFNDERNWFEGLKIELNRAADAAGNTIAAVRIRRHIPS